MLQFLGGIGGGLMMYSCCCPDLKKLFDSVGLLITSSGTIHEIRVAECLQGGLVASKRFNEAGIVS